MKLRTLAVLAAFGLLAVALVGAVPASAATASGWHVGYYTPSGRTLSSASAQTPATGGIATFDFTNQANTALLTTHQSAQFGNLLGGQSATGTITATFTVSNLTGTPFYYGEPLAAPVGMLPSVRFIFWTNATGGFNPAIWWWSNPASVAIENIGTSFTLTAPIGTSAGNSWSDWDGQSGTTQTDPSGYPSPEAGYQAAVSNITNIGLSFGGGWGFENGVGTTDGSGTFTLNSFTITPTPAP